MHLFFCSTFLNFYGSGTVIEKSIRHDSCPQGNHCLVNETDAQNGVEDALIENHCMLEAQKRVWSISPGLEVGLKKDTLGERSLELSLKRLRKSVPDRQCQGEHSRQGTE